MRVSNCTEFEQRLREAIESRASVDEATFCAHAADCDDCRRQWEEYLLLSVAVAEWNSGQPEIDLADAILAQHAFRENEEYAIQPTSQDVETANIATSTRLESRPTVFLQTAKTASDQIHSSRQRYSALAVIASAALVLCSIATLFDPPTVQEQLAGKMPTTSHAVPNRNMTDDEAAGADVEALVRDAGSAYMGLARDAAEVFTDTVAFIPEQTLPTADPTNALGSNSDDSEQSTPWGQELEPIRRDVGQAIDFLFETISTEAEPTT
ncbi:MAG: hypothetical protein HON53_08425 [Planctomycetaceae bacterium]|jgi:hypothetical protein|nr:hypothetical protein [Planctomycetaceae bacterium]MBT6157152.1 hypothetical protein [Planctomycetaceae bacterium]MBT6483622.1 hypothetical protein [Planctomycetaceae bacterium]MBT6495770.1 hypothetical protein [Planctomycetaceae bacterium]